MTATVTAGHRAATEAWRGFTDHALSLGELAPPAAAGLRDDAAFDVAAAPHKWCRCARSAEHRRVGAALPALMAGRVSIWGPLSAGDRGELW